MALGPQKLNPRNNEHNLRTLWRELRHIGAQWRREGAVPGATDDNKEGFDIGAIWVDTATNTPYICVDNTTNAAIWVDVLSGSSTVLQTTNILAAATASTVPATTQTTVASYTAGADTRITDVYGSGHDNAKWQVYIDSVLQMTQRAGNGDRNVQINFNTPLLLSNGSTLDVKVTHYFTAETLDFEATILGYN
jgi:hypothetical protein